MQEFQGMLDVLFNFNYKSYEFISDFRKKYDLLSFG